MSLTVSSFFNQYIVQPFEAETVRDRAMALVASIALGVIALGVVHVVCGLRLWCAKKKNVVEEVDEKMVTIFRREVSPDQVKRSAEEGDADQQFFLGKMYVRGVGVEQSDEKAFEWLQKASLQEHAKAQFAFGKLYFHGRGVEKSEEIAADWCRGAALKGYPRAQFQLGLLLQEGTGVRKSLRQAERWYEKAADQGNRSAIKALRALRR